MGSINKVVLQSGIRATDDRDANLGHEIIRHHKSHMSIRISQGSRHPPPIPRRLRTLPRPHSAVTQTSGVIYQPVARCGGAVEPKLLGRSKKKKKKMRAKTGDVRESVSKRLVKGGTK